MGAWRGCANWPSGCGSGAGSQAGRVLQRRARATEKHMTASGTTTKIAASKMPWPRLSRPKARAVGTNTPYPTVLTTDEAPARIADGTASCRERVRAMLRTVTPKIVAT